MKYRAQELSFLIKLLSIIAGASLLSYALLYFFMDTLVGPDYKTAFHAISGTYAKMNYYIVMAVLVQIVISCLMVFFIALYYSHRIAGPMYRLRLSIQQFLDGDNVEKVFFRKSDFLQVVARDFTEFFGQLKRRKMLFAKTKSLIKDMDLKDREKNRKSLEEIKTILDTLEAR